MSLSYLTQVIAQATYISFAYIGPHYYKVIYRCSTTMIWFHPFSCYGTQLSSITNASSASYGTMFAFCLFLTPYLCRDVQASLVFTYWWHQDPHSQKISEFISIDFTAVPVLVLPLKTFKQLLLWMWFLMFHSAGSQDSALTSSHNCA